MNACGRVALITGIRGQDGAYLANLLDRMGYRVIGLVRELDVPAAHDRQPLPASAELIACDLTDLRELERILASTRPHEFYNLAARASGAGMFDEPLAIADINGVAVARILEAIRTVDPAIRLCQVGSSELFGEPLESPQNERTPFNPRSPYGAAKLYAHTMVNVYRKHYGLFACSAIVFNHESPYRGLGFVTRKICHAAASIKLGFSNRLSLGNLEARRDWGFAGDYVEAMRLMLQAAAPADYVIATGETHSVRELCQAAFEHVGLDYRDFVQEDPGSFRQEEARQLVGDPSKAARELGWKARLSLSDLVRMMVDADLERLRASGC
jgi:GDPmannose 4,6-dehydratase